MISGKDKIMGLWGNIISGLKGAFGQRRQDEQTAPEPRGGFMSAVFGTGSADPNDGEISNVEAQQAADDLGSFAVEDRSQGLFYLGWLDMNISKDVRDSARRRWEQEYGEWNPRKGRNTLSPEAWTQWRAWMEKNGSP